MFIIIFQILMCLLQPSSYHEKYALCKIVSNETKYYDIPKTRQLNVFIAKINSDTIMLLSRNSDKFEKNIKYDSIKVDSTYLIKLIFVPDERKYGNYEYLNKNIFEQITSYIISCDLKNHRSPLVFISISDIITKDSLFREQEYIRNIENNSLKLFYSSPDIIGNYVRKECEIENK